jgi:hypothetical protein
MMIVTGWGQKRPTDSNIQKYLTDVLPYPAGRAGDASSNALLLHAADLPVAHEYVLSRRMPGTTGLHIR